jgi:D-sedoheptulose 7-phosphate isomerase
MKTRVNEILSRLFIDNPALSICGESIRQSFEIILECYRNHGQVLICGNGGSAADSEHIVGELMKSFLISRPVNRETREKIQRMFPVDGKYMADNLQCALPAISLVSQTAISSAYINDVQPDMVFAQQVYGYGKSGDVLMGLSTSGNSGNVLNAIHIGKVLGMKTIGMTGEGGGKMKGLCDAVIRVPAVETYRIQEFHLPVYHALCAMIEEEFWGE